MFWLFVRATWHRTSLDRARACQLSLATAGTSDCVLCMAQYDSRRDRIICGWKLGKPAEWGAIQNLYCI